MQRDSTQTVPLHPHFARPNTAGFVTRITVSQKVSVNKLYNANNSIEDGQIIRRHCVWLW